MNLAANQVKAVEAGGIKTVVKAINAHIHNSSACIAGCGALRNMIKNNSTNYNLI